MLIDQSFINEIREIIFQSRDNAIRSVNWERTIMYWKIGKRIFEEEQQGKDRADYGTYLIKQLSLQIQPEFGSGFGIRQLERYRQFYRLFPIASALRTQFNWTHYKLLISINDEHKREYYIAESSNNNWTSRQLERQINSQLYERLLLSNDKESVLAVARKVKNPVHPLEIIKEPMVLEFLGLKPNSAYYEKDLEQAIINHLQDFILEMGNGFAFIARQKRIHLDGDDFFVDLVFYNRLLQCFVVIDLKIGKLTHQDLGQLQMYVNYFDRVEKADFENPTIGILLCADKNDSVVRFSLPENNKTILSGKYQLYLPTENQILDELRKELDEFQIKQNEQNE